MGACKDSSGVVHVLHSVTANMRLALSIRLHLATPWRAENTRQMYDIDVVVLPYSVSRRAIDIPSTFSKVPVIE